tara:strand:+ start:9078 stop:9890 length:813 start_codon:yes stop_codon:yes gene_type:complete
MKTAIILSGQLRGFPLCYQSIIDNISSQFPNPDFFHYGPPEPDGKKVEDYLECKALYEPDDLEAAKGVHPAGIGGASAAASKNNGHPEHELVLHFALQWKNLMKAFELIPQGYYDLVVRLRPDTYSISPIDSESIINEVDDSSIHIPQFDAYNGVNDRFAVGTYEPMKVYCNLYKGLIGEGRYDSGGSEDRLREHLKKNKIRLKYLNWCFCCRSKDGAFRGCPESYANLPMEEISRWESFKKDRYDRWVHGQGYYDELPEGVIADRHPNR